MKMKSAKVRRAKAPAEPSGNAVVYLRVSTERQADSGLGLSAQRAACERFCQAKGLAILAEFKDEGASGSLPIEKRDGLLAAVAALGPGDALVVAKLDRLARDVVISHLLEQDIKGRGARLLSATHEGNDDESPSGKLMRGIISLLAEYERAMISWRTAQAHAALRAMRAKQNAHVPYGSRVSRVIETLKRDGTIGQRTIFEDEPAEQAVLRRIETQRQIGLTLEDIADRLNADGIFRRSGDPWTRRAIHAILNRGIGAASSDQET